MCRHIKPSLFVEYEFMTVLKAKKVAFCEAVLSQGLAAALEFDPSVFAAADWARFDAALKIAFGPLADGQRDTAAIVRLLEGTAHA